MSDFDSEEERQRLWEDARWTDREMFNFASAVQHHGFSNIKKITEIVGTKSEDAVEALITKEVQDRCKIMFGFKSYNRASNFHGLRPKKGTSKGWSVLRKWQKIAQNQQGSVARAVDYSCLVIPAIWKRFRDEAESPCDPQELDVPALYNYVFECLNGRSPPELLPKESAFMLMLMQLVSDMVRELDMQEEIQFAQKFKKATTFLPINDEKIMKKRKIVYCKPIPDDAVFVQKNMHSLLKNHRRLVQSFNPLTVPLHLLHKEQKQLHSMFSD